MEKLTWKDLKDFVNEVSPEFENDEVVVLLDDDGDSINISNAAILDEDIYGNVNDIEDAGSLEDLKEIHGDSLNMDDYTIIAPKGTPLLMTI